MFRPEDTSDLNERERRVRLIPGEQPSQVFFQLQPTHIDQALLMVDASADGRLLAQLQLSLDELAVAAVAFDEVLRATESRVDCGGKGFNVSRMLASLGAAAAPASAAPAATAQPPIRAVSWLAGRRDSPRTEREPAAKAPRARMQHLAAT